VPYHFVGRAPDSMRTDADGNVYVAMYHQGRILVFSPYGMPIGQIVLPGRDQNHFLKSTSLAFVPDSSDIVIVSRDEIGGQGAMIFRAGAFAHGTRLFSHQ
jgi:lactonase